MLPKPWYRPPCDGGKSSGRFAFASPSPAKKLSLAAFWSGNDVAAGRGELVGVEEKEAGEPVRAGPLRPEDLDFLRPCADEGRPTAPRGLGAVSLSAGGGDGDQVLPASSASSWMKFVSVRGQMRTSINLPSHDTEWQPTNDMYRRHSCPQYSHSDRLGRTS